MAVTYRKFRSNRSCCERIR